MKYMVSGIPLLSTKLPGMPEEYYPYVYLFDVETTEGYANKLNELLSYPVEKLFNYGCKAQQWILKRKNNTIQAELYYN